MQQIADNMVTLTGECWQCYQVGVHYGAASELKDMAEHAGKVGKHYKLQLEGLRAALAEQLPANSPLHVTIQELPSLASALITMEAQLRTRAIAHSKAGADQLKNIKLSASKQTETTVLESLSRVWFMRVVVLGAVSLLGTLLALAYALGGSR